MNKLLEILVIISILLVLFACSEKLPLNNPYDSEADPESWAPTNLQYEILDINSIQLNWVDNSNNEEGFRIEKKVSTSNWQIAFSELPENTVTWIDDNANINETIKYRVYGFAEGNSSNMIETEIIDNEIPIPSNLQLIQGTNQTFTLTWIDNCIGEDGYKIERREYDGAFEIIEITGENVTTFVDDNIDDSIVYFYRIQCYYQSFQSEYSSEVRSYFEIFVPDEFITIQSAIDNSINDNRVVVHPGIYYENINFNGHCIQVISSDGAGNTIIDGSNNGSVVTFESGETNAAVLKGFTLMNGVHRDGGGIYCYSSNPHLSNLIICQNTANGFEYSAGKGGGLYLNDSSPFLENLVISNNISNCSPWELGDGEYGGKSAGSGAGIYFSNSTVSLFNTTITENVSQNGYNNWESGYFVTYGEGGIYNQQSIINIVNSIVFNNSYYEINALLAAEYSDILGSWVGTGNIDAAPLFINPQNGDYHLQSGSPCIDAGNPASEYNDADGSINDMGAYGGPNGNW